MRVRKLQALFAIAVSASLFHFASEASQGADAGPDSVNHLGHIKVAVKGFFKCVGCNNPMHLDSAGYALLYRGRKIPTHSFCESAVRSNPAVYQTYFASLQPRGALFQENETSQTGVKAGWFIFGLIVLVALLAGGLSGYAAVSKGLQPIPNFFIGLTIVGLFYVLTRPSAVKPGEVPDGLVKVPTTSAPVPCEKCGYTNHPSAKKCAGCGTKLKPVVQSEVARAR
ncbi:zinc finger Ran-binding domain-containing protein [candidate division KSB1 bacterium]|nr:zinc finger Ran-binding domain-containing protein [candidate division KSB1 bacterium]